MDMPCEFRECGARISGNQSTTRLVNEIIRIHKNSDRNCTYFAFDDMVR